MAKKTTELHQDADSRTKHFVEIERTQGEEPGRAAKALHRKERPRDPDEKLKRLVCKIVEDSGADFIKTATGCAPGGATAKPFKTYHNALGMNLYLRVAPELYLKRLVIGGLERVFEINRNFRNEGVSVKHNPEFTMLEFYQAFATYQDMLSLTEELFAALTAAVNGGAPQVEYQGNVIDLSPPWQRYRLLDSLTEVGQVPPGRPFVLPDPAPALLAE